MMISFSFQGFNFRYFSAAGLRGLATMEAARGNRLAGFVTNLPENDEIIAVDQTAK